MCKSLHHMPENWKVGRVVPMLGRVRVECKHCGTLIGYRPQERDANGRLDGIDSGKRSAVSKKSGR